MAKWIRQVPRLALCVCCLACAARAGAQSAGAPAPPAALTLERARAYALEHYPAVRAALEQIAASEADVRGAQAAYLPRLDAMWQTNRGTANNVFGQLLPQSVIPAMSGPALSTASAGSAWGSAAGALFSWEPFDLGLRDATVRAARAGVSRAATERAVTTLGVEAAVASAFLAVVSADEARAAADADVERRAVLARVAHTLADNQLRPGAEASRADAEHAAARTRSIQARQAAAVARTLLARVLGVPAGSVSIDPAALLETTPKAAVAGTAVATHPAVQASEAGVELSRSREAILQKTDRPRFLLQSALFARGTGAGVDGSFGTGASGLGLDRANWSAGVQVVFPNLFDYASLRARRSQAAALTRIEQARADESRLSVAAQQQAALAVLEAAFAIAQNTPEQLAAARQSEAQARARYDAGLASIVEVAESQNLLAGAEYQDALARIDVWRALLSDAAGRGDLEPFFARARTSGVQ